MAPNGAAVWAYGLMPNHVPMIMVPQSEEGLRRAIGEAHRRGIRVGAIFGKAGGGIYGKGDSPPVR